MQGASLTIPRLWQGERVGIGRQKRPGSSAVFVQTARQPMPAADRAAMSLEERGCSEGGNGLGKLVGLEHSAGQGVVKQFGQQRQRDAITQPRIPGLPERLFVGNHGLSATLRPADSPASAVEREIAMQDNVEAKVEWHRFGTIVCDRQEHSPAHG